MRRKSIITSEQKGFIVGFIGCIIAIAIPIIAGNITSEATTETVTEVKQDDSSMEQKYIVRFATAQEITPGGITIYVDYDGNRWEAIDAPTKIGDDARLLFDSKETFDITDDEIIDITEIK